MSILKKLFSALLVSVFTLTSLNVSAQTTFKLPGQHTQNSQDRLANQTSTKLNTFASPTVDYFNRNNNEKTLDLLSSDDIYEYGWTSGKVNCYNDVEVPQRANIDVSKFAIPHPGIVTSPYGYRATFKRMHRGIDLRLNVGDTVRAAFDGRVRITNYEARGYGYYVVLRHYNQLETVYGHLSKFLVKDGQYVKAGQPIALGGNTGHSTGPHLHFETRYMGYAINPQAIFDFANKTVHTDVFTFDKNTYQKARNYAPKSNNNNTTLAVSKPKAQTTTPATNNTQKAPVKQNTAPVKKAQKAEPKNTSKTVAAKKGDSLSKIAHQNNTTVDRLCKLNGIKASATISPGQKIKVN